MASFDSIASGTAEHPGACVDGAARLRDAGRTTVPTAGSSWRRIMTPVDRPVERSDHRISIRRDCLDRARPRGAGLTALVRNRHVVGFTTNSTMCQQALTHGTHK